MLKKTDTEKKSPEREQSSQIGTGNKHQTLHSDETGSNWKRTPDWAIHYRTQVAPVSELSSLARRMEKLQQIRETYLGVELSSLGEPVWKILIRLVIATEERTKISLAEISQHSAIPEAIAERYINFLQTKGYIVRTQHQPDPYEDLLGLTNEGHSLMRKTLLQLDRI